MFPWTLSIDQYKPYVRSSYALGGKKVDDLDQATSGKAMAVFDPGKLYDRKPWNSQGDHLRPSRAFSSLSRPMAPLRPETKGMLPLPLTQARSDLPSRPRAPKSVGNSRGFHVSAVTGGEYRVGTAPRCLKLLFFQQSKQVGVPNSIRKILTVVVGGAEAEGLRTASITACLSALPLPVTCRLIVPTGTPW